MLITKKPKWKAQWAEIGGSRNYYRSVWEHNYALYLEMLKNKGFFKSWRHEPITLWFHGIKRGVVSYKPDFEVIDNYGNLSYREVKGWMDPKSKTKLKRMAKYYPDIPVKVIGKKEYNFIKKNFSGVLKGWQ